jgi:hypothetical protein
VAETPENGAAALGGFAPLAMTAKDSVAGELALQ